MGFKILRRTGVRSRRCQRTETSEQGNIWRNWRSSLAWRSYKGLLDLWRLWPINKNKFTILLSSYIFAERLSLFGLTGPIEMDLACENRRPSLGPGRKKDGIFYVHYEGKNLSLQLLWIASSGSVDVTRTSICSYNRSVAASQAKCMFWLLIALKDDLFPERI